MGDYWSIEVEVRLPNGTILSQPYGDYYHDNGREKVDGFLDAIRQIYGTPEIEEIDLADIEDYGDY